MSAIDVKMAMVMPLSRGLVTDQVVAAQSSVQSSVEAALGCLVDAHNDLVQQLQEQRGEVNVLIQNQGARVDEIRQELDTQKGELQSYLDAQLRRHEVEDELKAKEGERLQKALDNVQNSILAKLQVRFAGIDDRLTECAGSGEGIAKRVQVVEDELLKMKDTLDRDADRQRVEERLQSIEIEVQELMASIEHQQALGAEQDERSREREKARVQAEVRFAKRLKESEEEFKHKMDKAAVDAKSYVHDQVIWYQNKMMEQFEERLRKSQEDSRTAFATELFPLQIKINAVTDDRKEMLATVNSRANEIEANILKRLQEEWQVSDTRLDRITTRLEGHVEELANTRAWCATKIEACRVHRPEEVMEAKELLRQLREQVKNVQDRAVKADQETERLDKLSVTLGVKAEAFTELGQHLSLLSRSMDGILNHQSAASTHCIACGSAPRPSHSPPPTRDDGRRDRSPSEGPDLWTNGEVRRAMEEQALLWRMLGPKAQKLVTTGAVLGARPTSQGFQNSSQGGSSQGQGPPPGWEVVRDPVSQRAISPGSRPSEEPRGPGFAAASWTKQRSTEPNPSPTSSPNSSVHDLGSPRHFSAQRHSSGFQGRGFQGSESSQQRRLLPARPASAGAVRRNSDTEATEATSWGTTKSAPTATGDKAKAKQRPLSARAKIGGKT